MTTEKTKVTVVLPVTQYRRLLLLKEALSEKMGKQMSIDELVATIIEDFLDSK